MLATHRRVLYSALLGGSAWLGWSTAAAQPADAPGPRASSLSAMDVSAAEEPPIDAPKERRNLVAMLYLAGTFGTLGGDDFDGSQAAIYTRGNGQIEAALVPDPQEGPGLDVGFGFQSVRVPSDFGFWVMLAYTRTWFDALPYALEQGSQRVDVSSGGLRAELRGSYQVAERLIPYLGVTTDLVSLDLDKGHARIRSNIVYFDGESATLRGAGLGIGIGSVFRLGENFGVDVSVLYRVFYFSSIDGVPLQESAQGSGLALRAGPVLLF